MEPILATKLHIPSVHPNRISRSHLIQKLDEDLWQITGERFLRRLTLIAAPAGYGKSTLLCEWVRHLNIPVAWISFDEADSDPRRFLQYVIASIQTIQPGLGEADLAMLRLLQSEVTHEIATTVMTSLVNEISAIPQPFLLVFDDYHALQAQGIHPLVKLLLDHLPENLSLVIATRADPPLSLSRLRARRQMAEVRSIDLRFSESEANLFLRQVMQLDLRDPEILTLTEYTEGWIAGLQMAALALQGRSDTADFIRHFSGRERFVIDYLFEEVLSSLPDDLQTFLVQTSILEQLSGPLCDAVLGSQDGNAAVDPIAVSASPQSGQQTLEYLERANLFLVPLDQERRYYRYHHLFTDLLRHRLYTSFPGLVPQLHARAAAWFEKQGRLSPAFDHWIAARNYQSAALLIEKNGYIVFEQGNFQPLLSWLARIPKDLIYSRPWLCIFSSWSLVFTGRFSEAEAYLVSAEKILTPLLESADPVLLEPYGHVAVVREYLASRSQDAAGIIYYAELASKYVAADDRSIRSIISFFLGTGRYKSNQYELAHEAWAAAARFAKEAGNLLIAVNALCSLGELTRIQGKLHAAYEIYQEAARLAVDEMGRPLPVAAEVYVGRARLQYEWSNLQSVEADLFEAGKIFKLYPNFDLKIEYNILLSRLRSAQGDGPAAEQLIHELEQSDSQGSYKPAAALLAQRIHLYRAKGDLGMVTTITDQLDWSVGDRCLFALADAYTAYARTLIAQQDINQADHLLEACLTNLETNGLWTHALKALVVQAYALDLQGQHARAQAQMQRALSLAEPEGFINIFVDEGEPIRHLIVSCRTWIAQRMNGGSQEPYGSAASPRLLAYVDRLLSAFPGGQAEKIEKPPVKEIAYPELVDPLTERELEVLQLIAGGLSNKEIAEKLVVTVGTVKSHTSNIYRKLDVLGRTKALAKARELRLI